MNFPENEFPLGECNQIILIHTYCVPYRLGIGLMSQSFIRRSVGTRYNVYALYIYIYVYRVI